MNRDEVLFDYPVSQTFRRYEAYLQGYDIQNTEPPEDAPEEEPAHYTHQPHTHSYTKRQAGRLFFKVDKLETEVESLKKVILEKQPVKKKHLGVKIE